jgi:membrane protease YdiL (CAAX protease family)
LGAFLSGIVLAGILGGIAVVVTGDRDGPALLAAGFVGLWVPLVGAALLASRRFGTGSAAIDLGLQVRAGDIWPGLLVALTGLAASAVVQLLLSPFPELLGSNTGFVEDQASTATGAVLVALSTVVGAPIVEELFFRGLVLHAMLRFGAVAAIAGQALVFGLIHVDPTEGAGNVGIVLGIGVFGLVLGTAAHRFGRLGPVFWAHAFFNTAAVVPILLS